ncbi:MAG: ergothioneine biosynthesis glutamate--cysteine ligase EgtA [Actinobacteria bacterium]|nr:ergothioneine biosynthesis glutamate--cysteine ligase EgtA [Actinomycetota bacterium]
MGRRALRTPVEVPAPEANLTAPDVRAVTDECFEPSFEGRVGVEVEWLVVAPDDPCRPVPFPTVQHALEAVEPELEGCRLTFEPGGQVELSSSARVGIDAACRSVEHDASVARSALALHGLDLVGTGLDPLRPRRRVVDSPRYRAMERYFAPEWPAGASMMCGTASLQINLDVGFEDRVDERWKLTHALGPTLAAAFANSPIQDGRPTGWRSTRLAIWFALDASRAAPVASDMPACDAWEQYVLDSRVMLVRHGADSFTPMTDPLSFRAWMDGHASAGYPTIDDLRYHLTTLFPPVRPRGWLELRMIDALPDPWWQVAVAVTTALVDDDEAAERARHAVRHTRGLWREAARHAVHHPQLARSARDCFSAAIDALPRLGVDGSTADLVAEYRDRYLSRRRCPADEALAAWTRNGASAHRRDGSEPWLTMEPAWT